ncbi:MAG: hypothetical protein M1814_004426 [Vezdaea aestivalis]|nr:MAG: hypothetical protein M1814_004426 [Vezdaea aestivalis]
MPPTLATQCVNPFNAGRHLLSALLSSSAPKAQPRQFWMPTTSPRSTPSTLILPRRRSFHHTALYKSRALRNPILNDEGEELLLSITERAAARLSQISKSGETKNASQLLRINVEAGGCHGFQYLMSLERANDLAPNPPYEDSAPSNEDVPIDTIIASESHPNAQIILDKPSLELLAGSTVDYTKELIGAQFKIVGNPRATSSCGCGTSFDVIE